MNIDGRCLTRQEFADHVAGLRRAPPRSIWLHHTWIPRLDQWRGRETIYGMKAWYEKQPWVDSQGRQRIGWTAGPHVFVAHDGIWLFTSLEQDGVHCRGHNQGTIGIEMVGDYDAAPPRGLVLENTVDALATLFHRWAMDPAGLMFHRDASTKTCPGNAVAKDWVVGLVEKRLARRRGEFGSALTVHNHHPTYPGWLKGHVAQMDPEFVKVMDPDRGVAQPYGDGLHYIGRLHFGEGEPDKQLVALGAEGADHYWSMARPRIEACPWISWWEGPNEPDVTTEQGCRNLAAFWGRLADIYHDHNLCAAGFSLATGNPPEMGWWRILAPAAARLDAVEVHEYAMTRHMLVDGWHLGRLLRADEILQSKGVAVDWIVGETGVDRGGGKATDGWRARGMSRREYLEGLTGYEGVLREQLGPRLLFVSPFTWTTPDWTSFRIDEWMSRDIAEYVASTRGAEAVTEPLPEHETATDPATIAEKVRWWVEEMQRAHEGGNLDRAERIRLSLITLLYRLEQSLKKGNHGQ